MQGVRYIKGDATAPIGQGTNRIIVHVCNDIGGWGLGFVLAISKRWSEPEGEYSRWFKQAHGGSLPLGAVQFVKVEDDIWVANLIGQHKLAADKKTGIPPIRYEAIKMGLAQVAKKALELNASIHMPRIGCGLAGGVWVKVEPIITEQLVSQGLEVVVYDLH